MKTEVIHTPVFTYNLLVIPGNLRQEILHPLACYIPFAVVLIATKICYCLNFYSLIIDAATSCSVKFSLL